MTNKPLEPRVPFTLGCQDFTVSRISPDVELGMTPDVSLPLNPPKDLEYTWRRKIVDMIPTDRFSEYRVSRCPTFLIYFSSICFAI